MCRNFFIKCHPTFHKYIFITWSASTRATCSRSCSCWCKPLPWKAERKWSLLDGVDGLLWSSGAELTASAAAAAIRAWSRSAELASDKLSDMAWRPSSKRASVFTWIKKRRFKNECPLFGVRFPGQRFTIIKDIFSEKWRSATNFKIFIYKIENRRHIKYQYKNQCKIWILMD